VVSCGAVLVVDDDSDFRKFVCQLFARASYETVEAGSGGEALAAARTARPALVLLDISLPDVSGFEVCRELRDEFGDDLPIIFVSGERVEAVDRAVGLLLGADDYVVKPFDSDELLARVRRSIIRSQGGRNSLRAVSDGLDLTKRELEVLEGLAEGLRPAQIAARLVISPKTVSSHVQRILAKLGVHSRAHAVAIAYQSGLLSPTNGEAEAIADRRLTA
jgi:DNA-binding NarL/FixJ family response regulator